MKNIKWVYNVLCSRFFGCLGCLVIPKNKKYIALCCYCERKDFFLHNTKYLFLYLNQKVSDYKCFWFCDDNEQIKTIKSYGYKNVFKRHSIKGIYYSLRCKYWLHNYTTGELPRWSLHFATIINLWHGASGIKKCGIDYGAIKKFNKNFIYKIYNFLNFKDSFYIINSKYEAECRKQAFNITDKPIVYLGSPRLDILYKDIPDAEIFSEEDFKNIKRFNEQGKKVFIYMPTFRDTGKDISGWLHSDELHNVLSENNAILVCKLHPFDKNNTKFNTKNIYKMNNISDIYPILKYSDCLITDYSSIYMDYLHLDKPIIHHIPDLKEYEGDRGFYRPFETLTAGIATTNEKELLQAISNTANGVDNYKQRRKELLNEIFIYQDVRNCERIVEFIKKLNQQ